MGSAERERRMNGRTELAGIAEGLVIECSYAARHAQAVMELKGGCICGRRRRRRRCGARSPCKIIKKH
jgi:hypothetical protein